MTEKNKKQATSHTEIKVETHSEQHVSNGDDSRVAELEAQIAELTHDAQRVQAEFINFKRREAEAKSEIANFATMQVVKELLPMLDNIERALAHRPEDLAENSWALGVEQVGKQVGDALSALGIERFESVGQPFDHNLHEAVSMEDGEGDIEVVTEELQPGYKMGDKILRHAMVKVGKK